MSRDFQSDKRWSDRFLPEIKRIAGQLLMNEPPIEEDTLRNTDLIVLGMKSVRMACRVRDYAYWMKYPHDFTVRFSRPNERATEFEKIITGWGDYLLYAFANQDESGLCFWRMIDLGQFRLWVHQFTTKNSGKTPGIEINNHDRSSSFKAFDTRTCPQGVICADSNSISQLEAKPTQQKVLLPSKIFSWIDVLKGNGSPNA